jgi:uncharacterized phage protein gp47/JayE
MNTPKYGYVQYGYGENATQYGYLYWIMRFLSSDTNDDLWLSEWVAMNIVRPLSMWVKPTVATKEWNKAVPSTTKVWAKR